MKGLLVGVIVCQCPPRQLCKCGDFSRTINFNEFICFTEGTIKPTQELMKAEPCPK